MDKKNYLVQIDTTESTTRNNLPPGILNTFVVRAYDAIHAKQTILKIYNNRVAEQIKSSLYVYELEDMMKNLEKVDAAGDVPLFSFMPLRGGRPPRQTDAQLAQTSLGNDTLNPNTVASNEQKSAQSQTPVQTVVRGSRTQEFQDVDMGRPTVKNALNEEQANLVRSVGAIPMQNGADERVNLRVNAATGVNNNLGSVPADAQSILKNFGINPSSGDTFVDPELQQEIASAKGTPLIDDSLARIEGAPLDDAAIQALEAELKNTTN